MTSYTATLLTSAAVAMTLTSSGRQTAPPPRPEPQAQAQSPATAKPGTVVVSVVTEAGAALADATVRAHGPVDRGGTSGTDGLVTFQNAPAGTYRCRITLAGFITLDKEITVRAGAKSQVEAVLSAAPPAPPPPPPPPLVETRPALAPGDPVVLELAAMLDPIARGSQPLVERDLGCSGATTPKAIVAKENIGLHRHIEADEVLYVIAGEATLTIDSKDQNIAAGSVALIPRGMSHAITRRGRNPLAMLSVQSGAPCKK